ncbi:MAG: hypothetical protein ACKVI4_14585, partial [Actinomycetales bacterium]
MAALTSIWADDTPAGFVEGVSGGESSEAQRSTQEAAEIRQERADQSQEAQFGRGLANRERQGRRIEQYGQDDQGDADEEFELAQQQRERAQDDDSLGQFLLAAPRTRARRGLLTQVGDALQLCRDMVTTQFQKALDMREAAKQNENISGDAFARTAIQTLLPNEQQRQLFLETAGNPATWPRLKPLFGAPPYHFLQQSDAGVLRATGMSKGRTHMTYESSNAMMNITTITGFGAGQLQDQHDRQYRVMPAKLQAMADTETLPFRLSEYRDASNVVMHVKVPKRSRDEKRRLLASPVTKKRLFFPQPGEKLTLRETGRLMALINQEVQTNTDVVVKRVVPRDEHA